MQEFKILRRKQSQEGDTGSKQEPVPVRAFNLMKVRATNVLFPIPGFRLSECSRLVGDELDQVVHWSNGSDVSSLAGHPVRMHLLLQDADLFAFQFSQNP